MTLYPNCGSAHLETILSLVSLACQTHLLSCTIRLPTWLEKLAVLSWLSTRIPPPPTTLERKPACHKHNRPDLDTSCIHAKMDTYKEGGGEVDTSQLHSRHKQGSMNNIFLTDSDKKATMYIVKGHKELYNKTHEHFKDKARKESP